MDPKEIEDFAVRFGGAMLGGLEDAALEAYWKMNPDMSGKFPYTSLHDKLPPNDDLIVGGLAIPPWVIGALMEDEGEKKGNTQLREQGKALKKFGEGDVIYSGNMLIHETVLRAPTPRLIVPAKRVVSSKTDTGMGNRKADVGHKILKL